MAEVFGNVNVKYNPCKSISQLKSTADYILGNEKNRLQKGLKKQDQSFTTHLDVIGTILQIA